MGQLPLRRFHPGRERPTHRTVATSNAAMRCWNPQTDRQALSTRDRRPSTAEPRSCRSEPFTACAGTVPQPWPASPVSQVPSLGRIAPRGWRKGLTATNSQPLARSFDAFSIPPPQPTGPSLLPKHLKISRQTGPLPEAQALVEGPYPRGVWDPHMNCRQNLAPSSARFRVPTRLVLPNDKDCADGIRHSLPQVKIIATSFIYESHRATVVLSCTWRSTRLWSPEQLRTTESAPICRSGTSLL
jgi:hypothetical protein